MLWFIICNQIHNETYHILYILYTLSHFDTICLPQKDDGDLNSKSAELWIWKTHHDVQCLWSAANDKLPWTGY